VLAGELLLALSLLLGATNVELLALEVALVEGLASGASLVVGGEVDEAKAPGLAGVVPHDDGGENLAVGPKDLVELLITKVLGEVLHEDVGEVLLLLLVLGRALPPGDVVPNKHLLLVQEHSVHLGDGELGTLSALKVDKAKAAGVAVLVDHDLAREDVSKGAEGVVERLVVDGLVEVLDEDVSDTGLAEGGVALGPHDAEGPALDQGVVQGVQSALGVGGRGEVHVAVAQGAAKGKKREKLMTNGKKKAKKTTQRQVDCVIVFEEEKN